MFHFFNNCSKSPLHDNRIPLKRKCKRINNLSTNILVKEIKNKSDLKLSANEELNMVNNMNNETIQDSKSFESINQEEHNDQNLHFNNTSLDSFITFKPKLWIEDNKQIRNLLLERRYPINETYTKWIAIGVDPIKNFEVFVKFTSSDSIHGIQFNFNEFSELIECENLILSYFDNKSNVEYQKLYKHELFFHLYNNLKVLTISFENKKMCFGNRSIETFFKLKNLISYYFNYLSSLNLLQTFSNILIKANSIDEDIFYNINYIVNNENDLTCLAIKELLIMYPEVVIQKMCSINEL